MAIRIRKNKPDEEIHEFPDSTSLKKAIKAGQISGRDQYFAPSENSWIELDAHPEFSTTDARGIYPAIVHLVVFIKIFVFIAFLSILDGAPEMLLHAGAIYVYVVLFGDLICILLAHMNRNRLAAGLLWVFGIGTMPLGFFLIVSAGMTRTFRFIPAE